jgi:hypothetical protein
MARQMYETKTSPKLLKQIRENYNRWKESQPKEHGIYKQKLKAYMKPFRIEPPKGYVQTRDALKILGIPYAKKSRIHAIKHRFTYVVLNDKIGRGNHTKGRYYWEVKSLRG